MNTGVILAYAILGISIFFEVISTSTLPYSKGFTVPKQTLMCAAGYSLCYYFFANCISPNEFFGITLVPINLGVGYATWGAVGTIVTAVVGTRIYHEPLTRKGVLALIIIIVSIIVLNLFGSA